MDGTVTGKQKASPLDDLLKHAKEVAGRGSEVSGEVVHHVNLILGVLGTVGDKEAEAAKQLEGFVAEMRDVLTEINGYFLLTREAALRLD